MIEYDNFIQVSTDIYTKEWCEDVSNFYDKCVDEKLVGGSTDDTEMPKLMREDSVIHLPRGLMSECIPSTWTTHYWAKLSNLVNDYRKKYSISEELSSYNYKIHKATKTQGYHIFHCEWAPDARDRVLAYMTYIKIPEAGGETEFLHQSKRVEPSLGLTLIWPAYYTHLHRGNPVLEGEKMYITGWWVLD